MPRKDYDTIKENFSKFINCFKTRDTESLDFLCEEEVVANFSTVKNGLDGSMYTISSIKDLVNNYPKTDELNMSIYNYVCRLCDNHAQQFAYVVCVALNNSKNDADELDYFFYTKIFANHWIKREDGSWRMDSIKMDVYRQRGILNDYFEKFWHFEDIAAILKPGVHYPCIMPEFDSPWLVIPESEDILTEEEKVKDGLYRYNFGIDQLSVTHCLDGIASSYAVSGVKHHGEGKRKWLTGVKFNRQKARHWVHPYKFADIKIEGDRAYIICYRTAYQKQMSHEYIWTNKNKDIEHASARCQIEMVKENGMWKMCYFGYDVGLYEVGKYNQNLYGDLI